MEQYVGTIFTLGSFPLFSRYPVNESSIGMFVYVLLDWGYEKRRERAWFDKNAVHYGLDPKMRFIKRHQLTIILIQIEQQDDSIAT